MTVEHSALTGTSLHESKGVAAAAANTVYVANGAGSGSWTTITNPFSSGLLHVREEQTSGTEGTTITPINTWFTRPLNTTKTTEIAGASVSGNQITGLPAGTYYIEVVATVYAKNGTISSSSQGTGIHKLRLQNITATSTLINGLNIPPTFFTESAGNYSMYNGHTMGLSGRFTLGSTSTIELQHYFTNNSGMNAPTDVVTTGKAASITSVNEVYTDIRIWKVI